MSDCEENKTEELSGEQKFYQTMKHMVSMVLQGHIAQTEIKDSKSGKTIMVTMEPVLPQPPFKLPDEVMVMMPTAGGMQ